MEIESVAIESIQVGARMRNLDDERVEALASSLKALGLQTPISVWASDDGSEVRLVAGHHRLAAARKLGWEDIDCALVNMTDIDRKRWEIAENLHRSELTALERDQHVAEWIRLTEEAEKGEKEVSPQSVAKPGRPSSGVRKAAKELNVNREDARRAVKVDSLTDEAKEAARDLELDNNRSALLKAAKEETPEKQVETLREIKAQKDEPKAKPPKPKLTSVTTSTDRRGIDEDIRRVARTMVDEVVKMYSSRDLQVWLDEIVTLTSVQIGRKSVDEPAA